MTKVCPINTICIETTTIYILGGLLLLVAFFWKESFRFRGMIHETNMVTNQQPLPVYNPLPLDSYTRQPRDVLLNPYAPPLRLSVPDNTRYHQVGILKSKHSSTVILPLMAKSLNRRRDMWQYYTIHDRNTIVKLPVISKSKSCTGEMGCDALSTGDTVMVESYNNPFIVTLYDSAGITYDPDSY